MKISIKPKKGFTLIEIIIAVFMISLSVVAILAIFPVGIKINSSSQMESIAIQLAQARIEEKISKSYYENPVGTVVEDYGTIEEFGGYKIETTINFVYVDQGGNINPDQISQSDTDIKRIKISVFWRSSWGGSEKKIETSTLTSKQ